MGHELIDLNYSYYWSHPQPYWEKHNSPIKHAHLIALIGSVMPPVQHLSFSFVM